MTSLIYDDATGLYLNKPMIEYMNDIMNKKKIRVKHVDAFFQPEMLSFANKSIKTGNYYILDKFDLVIRKLDQNKSKSAYGWVYDEQGDPINIHINKMLLSTNSDNITVVTLQKLKAKFPTIFKPPRGQLYKIYSNINIPNVNISKI